MNGSPDLRSADLPGAVESIESVASIRSRVDGWSEADLAFLKAKVAEGWSYPRIGQAMARSASAVNKKAGREGFAPGAGTGLYAQQQRARLNGGWPTMRGTPEDREDQHVRDYLREAIAVGAIKVRASHLLSDINTSSTSLNPPNPAGVALVP